METSTLETFMPGGKRRWMRRAVGLPFSMQDVSGKRDHEYAKSDDEAKKRVLRSASRCQTSLLVSMTFVVVLTLIAVNFHRVSATLFVPMVRGISHSSY
jgi:hypothetical protein